MPLDKDLRDGIKSESSPETAEQAEPAKSAAPAGMEYPAPKHHTVDPVPVPKTTPVPAAASASKPVPPPAQAPAPAPAPAPKPMAAPAPRPMPASGGQAAPVPAGMTMQLTKIERQLSSVNEDLAKLMKTLETQREKPADYTTILAKIDAAQAALEKKLASILGRAEEESVLETLVRAIADKQDKIERNLTQTLRDNASFQVQVRQRMQHDLDELREQQSGGQFNSILKEIASMYAEYQSVLEDEGMEPKTRRNIQALFEQMEDLLNEYDAEVCVSKVGDPRPKRQCKIIKQIPTGDESKHNTIAQSRKPGVVRGRLVLNHEFVDVYVFDPALKPKDEPIEPPVDEQPPVDAVPPVDEQPPVDEIPPVEEQPPVTEIPPVEEQPPVTEIPPVEEQPPVTEIPPVEEQPPVAEIHPVEEQPSAGDAPAQESTTDENTVPAQEEPPAEEPPAVEEAPAAEAAAEAEAAPDESSAPSEPAVPDTQPPEPKQSGADAPHQVTDAILFTTGSGEGKNEKQGFWKRAFGLK